MIINELVTKLSFKQDKGLSGYQKSMMNAQRSTERAAKGMEGAMARSSSAINKMIKFDVQMRTNSAQAKVQALSKMLSGLKNVAAMGLSIAGGVGVGAAAGAGAVGKFAFDAGKEYERLQAALVTATGGEKQANAAYKQIEQFAKKTPYDLTQVADAFIKLKNLGLNPSQEALTAYGNTAGAMGKDLNQMIEAVADASTGEFERLKEFGIKSKTEGNKVTFTFRGVKTTINKDAKDIEKYLMDIGRVQFAGGMDRQAATIGGMTSTLGDNFQALGRAIWTGGLGDSAKKFVKWATEFTDKMQPIIEKQLPIFIKDMKKLSIDILPKIQPVLEGITAALMGMGAAYAYIKILAVADMIGKMVMAWRAMDTAMKLAAISGAVANATVMFIPVAIAAAVAAVAWFGWQVYKYMTQGSDALMGLRNQFPFLADSVMFVGELIKTWVPIVMQVANVVYGVLSLAFQGFMIVVQKLYENTFKPFVDFALWGLNGILWAIKKVTIDSDTWRAGVVAIQGAFKTMYETVKPWLDALGILLNSIGQGIADAVSKLPQLPGFLGGGGGQDQDAGQQGFAGYNAVFGGKFAQTAKQVAASMNTVNKCAYGFETSFEKMTGIAMRGHAYELKNQMDRNRLYKKVQVTDEQMKNLPPGFVVIHDKNEAYKGKGLGGKYGHVSVSLGNGMEASDHIQKQMVRHYAGGQRYVYMPVGGSGGGGGAAPVANVTVNVGGSNASPKQIAKAAGDATTKSLTKAKQQQRVAVNPGAK